MAEIRLVDRVPPEAGKHNCHECFSLDHDSTCPVLATPPRSLFFIGEAVATRAGWRVNKSSSRCSKGIFVLGKNEIGGAE